MNRPRFVSTFHSTFIKVIFSFCVPCLAVDMTLEYLTGHEGKWAIPSLIKREHWPFLDYFATQSKIFSKLAFQVFSHHNFTNFPYTFYLQNIDPIKKGGFLNFDPTKRGIFCFFIIFVSLLIWFPCIFDSLFWKCI